MVTRVEKDVVTNMPRQYVKVKTLAGLKQQQKEELLSLIGDTSNSALCILRGILQTEKQGLHYLEQKEGLMSEQEIPVSIFMQDSEISDEIKATIDKLFSEIILTKKMRYVGFTQAEKMIAAVYGKKEIPINIRRALTAIRYNPKKFHTN